MADKEPTTYQPYEQDAPNPNGFHRGILSLENEGVRRCSALCRCLRSARFRCPPRPLPRSPPALLGRVRPPRAATQPPPRAPAFGLAASAAALCLTGRTRLRRRTPSSPTLSG